MLLSLLTKLFVYLIEMAVMNTNYTKKSISYLGYCYTYVSSTYITLKDNLKFYECSSFLISVYISNFILSKLLFQGEKKSNQMHTVIWLMTGIPELFLTSVCQY